MVDLKDPSKPAGFVVALRDDGSALRNDGVELKPASLNPWYVLMTIAGEQTVLNWWEANEDVAVLNRRFWNGWACAGLDDEDRAVVADKLELTPNALAPLTSHEMDQIKAVFQARLGHQNIPEIDETIDLSNTHFLTAVLLDACFLSGEIDFQSSVFDGSLTFRNAVLDGDCQFQDSVISGV